jgi:hypothetical protein
MIQIEECIPILRVARAVLAPLAKSGLADYKSGMHSNRIAVVVLFLSNKNL